VSTCRVALCVDAYSITDPLLTSSEWNLKRSPEATDKPRILSYLLQLSLRMQIFIAFCIGTVEVSVLRGCKVLSPDDWYLVFRDNEIVLSLRVATFMKNDHYNVWRYYRSVSIGRARIIGWYGAVCQRKGWIMSFIGHKQNNFRGNDSFRGEPVRYRMHELCTVGYARTNVIGSRISYVIASVRSSVHWNICI
jgi:hypothetical protein